MTIKSITLLLCVLALTSIGQSVQAGCPFDDGSCQEYCGQQGCNLGYCGHFAWIQCICRKCGDEWNWYDKVHYNPDKQVNQTELDSLKLNGSAPLILTNNQAKRSQEPTVAVSALATTHAAAPLQARPLAGQQQQQQQQPQKQQVSTPATATTKQPEQQKVAATLTTLLIPDLSDGSRLDLNDIPDENSEKFLDYLTKNHEKLVQATNRGHSASSSSSTTRSSSQDGDNEAKDDEESESNNSNDDNDDAGADSQAEETVEIQISSSNNNQQQQQPPVGKPARSPAPPSTVTDEQSGPTMRLLRMAVIGRSPDDIFLA